MFVPASNVLGSTVPLSFYIKRLNGFAHRNVNVRTVPTFTKDSCIAAGHARTSEVDF